MSPSTSSRRVVAPSQCPATGSAAALASSVPPGRGGCPWPGGCGGEGAPAVSHILARGSCPPNRGPPRPAGTRRRGAAGSYLRRESSWMRPQTMSLASGLLGGPCGASALLVVGGGRWGWLDSLNWPTVGGWGVVPGPSHHPLWPRHLPGPRGEHWHLLGIAASGSGRNWLQERLG